LVREWGSTLTEGDGEPEGFCLEWPDPYDSLSKVAFAITGPKWNGPRFFCREIKKIGLGRRGSIMRPSIRPSRCEYTPRLHGHGLDQEFNSLDVSSTMPLPPTSRARPMPGWTLIASRLRRRRFRWVHDRPDLQDAGHIALGSLMLLSFYKVGSPDAALADLPSWLERVDCTWSCRSFSVTKAIQYYDFDGPATLNMLLSLPSSKGGHFRARIRDQNCCL